MGSLRLYKGIDMDSGKFMAVKVLTRPSGRSQEDWREELHYTLKREVETLSDISRVSKTSSILLFLKS